MFGNYAGSMPSFCKHRCLYVLMLLTPATAMASSVNTDEISAAALATQQQCQMLLHHDAEDYVDCVQARLRAERKPGTKKLGIAYFGWVGALNSARMSFPGATDAADHFLRQFRPLQRKLKVSDTALCATVPGDCVQRNARMLQMEALPAVREKHFDGGNSEGSGHRH